MLTSKAIRTLEFSSSGNVDAVGNDFTLEVVMEVFELTIPCRAKAEFRPHPCGFKTWLSLLMMSAAWGVVNPVSNHKGVDLPFQLLHTQGLADVQQERGG